LCSAPASSCGKNATLGVSIDLAIDLTWHLCAPAPRLAPPAGDLDSISRQIYFAFHARFMAKGSMLKLAGAPVSK
jgi:hypothetical protein